MPLITWNSLLETGVEPIDAEHHELVGLINRLHAAVIGQQGDAVIKDALDAMRNYTLYHFRNEEALMAREGYDGVEEHHQLHVDMIKTLDDLVSRHSIGEAGIADRLLEYLRDWLVRHILGSDRAVVSFLLKNRKPGV